MSAKGWHPNATTGDRKIDQAIARFIHDPRTLPCDVPDLSLAWWHAGGCDGVPERPHGPMPDVRDQPIPDTPNEALTRAEIMKARA